MRPDIERWDQTDEGARRPMLCGQEVPKAGHICAFFDSTEEKYDVLASYFADAIRAGDLVIDVVEAGTREDHLRGMTEAGVDMQTAIASGRIRLGSCEDTYFRDGRLDLDAVLEMLRTELEAARKGGSCVRTAGEMNWVARDPKLRRLALEYEARVNEITPSHDCTMLCVYDLAHTPAAMIADILATHPFAVVRGKLRENPWAVDPQEFIEMLNARASGTHEE